MTPTQDIDQLAMTLLGLHRIATPAGSTAGQQTPVYTITLCEQRLQMLQDASNALLRLGRRTEYLTIYADELEMQSQASLLNMEAATEAVKQMRRERDDLRLELEEMRMQNAAAAGAAELVRMRRDELELSCEAMQAELAALRAQEPAAWRDDVRKVLDGLDPEDWCGDERMIDVLERALGGDPS